MFVNFKKTFKNNKKNSKVPPVLINYLNQGLPKGYKYKTTNDGELILTTSNKEFKLGGFTFNLSENQKNILGDNYSLDDVLKYSYNAQEPISLKLVKKGYIKLDGVEVPINSLHYDFNNSIKFDESSFKAYPSRFPEPFFLKFGNEYYNKCIKVHRISNKSININSFFGDDKDSLIIEYSFNEKTNNLTINFSFNLNNAKSIDDIIATLELYNSFIDGNIMINDKKLEVNKLSEETNKKVDNETIMFWKKVKELEDKLNLKFDLKNFEIKDEIYLDINTLYNNLILKKPTRERAIINSLNGNWSTEQMIEMEKSVGNAILFEFEVEKEFELFNKNIKLNAIVIIFNSKIKEVTESKIILENADDKKSRFVSSMCFLSYDDMMLFKEKDINEKANFFINAEKI